MAQLGRLGESEIGVAWQGRYGSARHRVVGKSLAGMGWHGPDWHGGALIGMAG